MRKYALYKSSIIDDIQNSLSKIHITVDLWTSGNYKSILGVVGHYIATDGQLKHNVLGVRELIELASSFYTLHPGDVILTGTPQGVGPVRPGDVLLAKMDKIGEMRVNVGTRK